MRGHALMILAAGLLLAADEPKGDLDRFQGTWMLIAMDRNGQQVLEEGIKDSRVTFEGDHFTVKRGGKTLETGTIRLDPSRTPKAVDTTPGEGPDQGKTIRGIYELEEDILRTCTAPPGEERPTEFAAKEGTPFILLVYKRAKP